MQIHQVSAALDIKLKHANQQLHQLEQRLAQADPASHAQLMQEQAALINIRDKLAKSKALAWEAHRLQTGTHEQQRARQRWFGLALCGLSLVGMAWVVFALWQQ